MLVLALITFILNASFTTFITLGVLAEREKKTTFPRYLAAVSPHFVATIFGLLYVLNHTVITEVP